MSFKKLQKLILTTILICLTSITLFVAAPQQAKAQFVVETPSLTAWEVVKSVGTKILASIMQSGIVALMNAAQSFTQKIAYDMAVYVASGGSGQKPLFDGKSFGDYVKDTALDGAMSFITNFSDSTLGKYGFNVCAPSLSLIGKIRLGALEQMQILDNKPRCDFSTFTKAWDQFGSSLGNGEVLKNFGVMFEPGNSELEFAFEFNSKVVADTQQKLSMAIAERTSSGGWKDVKDFINGRVTTPSKIVQDTFSKATAEDPYAKAYQTIQLSGQALSDGAYSILPTMLSTFTNTLLNQSMKRVFEGLFKDTPPGDNVAGSGDANSPMGPAIGRRLAEQVYSDLIKPRIITASNYDQLLEFTTCPGDDKEKQVNNCVIDDGFAAAVRLADQGRPITIAQGIAQGYLDGSKPLISSKDARNEQIDCYQQGYCYSNLVQLRKARILPVGFELAADIASGNISAMQGSGGNANNLQAVINAFNDCSASGARDATHPYCHMIDPNWVLRLPKTQCKATVYGPTLASTAGSFRAQTCADPISCLSQDENGNCTGGYGYCTKEKNIWRISADTCQEQFNTCLAYNSRDKKQYNYLQNTTDFGSCSSDNVGCRAYSINQESGDWSLATGDAVYLNQNAEKCDAKNAGCAELYSKARGLAYNLLPNPSFEKSPGVPGWSGGVALSSDGTQSFDGQNAVNPAGANLLMNVPSVIKLAPNTAYAFSGYAKSSTAGTTQYRLALFLYTDPAAASASQFNPANIISTCKVAADKSMELAGEAAGTYSRVSCGFLTPGATLYARPLIGGNSWIDAVQLEEGSDATPFLSSGYGTVNSAFIKVAPDYLDCSAGSVDARCAGYAPTCRAEEVGCERYAPKNGSPSISGSVSINDVCPKSCSGYETYRQEKTIYERAKFPLYLIPSTAKTCNSADVGCDEFTDLAIEAKEYFSDIRQCIKLDPKNWEAFYTWEGSDQTGYQLRAHRLKTGAVQSGEIGPVPALIDNNYAACTKAIFMAPFADPKHNSDCREFYNAAGQVSYRLLSKTIIATDECIDYRKTDSTEADCKNSGGTPQYNPDNITFNLCIYHGYKAESRVCSPAGNKCRAYAGAASANLRIVSQDDFEGGAGGWNGGAVSSESLSAGGHSYKVGAGAGMNKGLTGQIFASQSYSISFWAKGNGGENMQISMTDALHGAGSAANFVVTLKGDWQYFELGPINTNQTISATPTIQIRLTSGTGFYIDNITLKESGQRLYLIKNSWTTPAVCDQTLQNVLLPQAMLGCKEYITRKNESIYLKSFSSLCRDEAVGCAPFQQTYDTAKDYNEYYNLICSLPNVSGGECKYNGETVCSIGVGASACRFNINNGTLSSASYQAFPIYSQSDYKDFNAFQAKLRTLSILPGTIFRDESTVETAADKALYIVDDKKYYCQEKDTGCSALGQPELYKTTGAATVYFKNLPDDYAKILCTAEGEGCESWTSNKGVDYFKVPKGECEYKNASGGEIGGWYKKGTNTACYLGFLKSGVYGIWRNADANFNGTAGLCPETQNGCTEFIDPLDTSAANKKGRPYYLLDNDKLKSLQNDATCSGKVSLEEGCVLFNKTSDINLIYNAGATYLKAIQEKKLTTPVDKGYCEYRENIGTVLNPKYSYGTNSVKPCLDDAKCPASGTAVSAGNVIAGVGKIYTGKCVVAKDANIILKVTRDRECSEWLACKTSYSATDPLTSKAKIVCAEVGLCDKIQAGAGGSSLCANFITANPDSGKVLSAENYSKRDTTWAGKDYSGFSLGNKYPITDIKTQDVDPSGGKDLRLYASGLCGNTGATCLTNQDCAQKGYPNIACTVLDMDGTPFNQGQAEKTTCRGYPEQDSPFPSSVAEYDMQGFKNANSCENGKNCECDYTKLTYGNKATVKYVEYGNRNVSSGICQGGLKDGLPCKPGVSFDEDSKNSCGKPEEGGTCLKLQRQDDVIGWSGYCLERDATTPINGDKNQKACITWLPQDIAPGQRDIYNQFRTAGYVSPIGGGKYYCMQAEGNYSDISKSGNNKYANLLVISDPNKQFTINNVKNGETMSCQYVGGGWTCPRFPEYPSTYSDTLSTAVNLTIDPVTKAETLQVAKPIYKDQIDLIEIKAIPFSGSNPNQTLPNGVAFHIRADRKETNYLGVGDFCNGKVKLDNCKGENTGTAGLTGKMKARTVRNKDNWQLRYDNGEGNLDLLSSDLSVYKTKEELAAFCSSAGSSQQTGINLKFEFDSASGEMKKMLMYTCGATWNLQINIYKREVCSFVADLAASKNQAYTDRLWLYNVSNTKGQEKPPVDPSSGTPLPYHYNYEMQPFGSAASDIAPGETGSWYNFYTVGTPSFAGVPWVCKGSCGTAGVLDEKTNTWGSDGDLSTVDFSQNIKNDEMSGYSGTDAAAEDLGYLFSKINSAFTLNDSRKYVEEKCTGSGLGEGNCNIPVLWDEIVKIPKVFSFDPNKKLTNGQYQLAQENKFLINNQSGDINITGNQLQATMRFYFWADTDHMSVKSIKVDWAGDGTYEFFTTDGLYKNHKPLCADSNDQKPPPLVCSLDRNIVCNTEVSCPSETVIKASAGSAAGGESFVVGTSTGPTFESGVKTQSCTGQELTFGNSPDACEEAYFELQHIYTCEKAPGETCVYEPKLLIVDNWGLDNSFDGSMLYGELAKHKGFLKAASGSTIRLTP